MASAASEPQPSAHGRLLISLTGVAQLARVRRPVASVWRSRHRRAASPFPAAVAIDGPTELFDADEIAAWLVTTGRGNNPDAVADAALTGLPSQLDLSRREHASELSALIALRALHGTSIAGASPGEMRRWAREWDADDDYLVAELDRHLRRTELWLDYADRLVDASYSPADALERIQARVIDRQGGSAGPLEQTAVQLTAALCAALATDAPSHLRVAAGVDAGLFGAIAEACGDGTDVAWPTGPAGRALRRAAVVAGRTATADDAPSGRTIALARLPETAATPDEGILSDVDALALELGRDDVAVVIAPARVLVDALPPAPESARAASMRDGRVRAVVRLPSGLVTTSAREALALWLLGPAVAAPLAERVTAIADLTDADLTEASRADLVSDLLAVLTGPQAARAHAFRFARVVRTSSLLARRGALTAEVAPRHARRRAPRDLPALLDAAIASAGADAPPLTHTVTDQPAPDAASIRLDGAVAAGHARVIAGVRLFDDEIGAHGLAVVTADDLDDPSRIGERRLDHLAFATRHPSAQLTRPGDIVFRTAPTARAWVDAEGSHVVAFPARVLRISAADPGGLVPELVAADIARGVSGPGAWRRWRLRVVDPAQRAALRAALSAVTATQAALRMRAAALDDLADLLSDAVAARAVTLTDPAAEAASDPR